MIYNNLKNQGIMSGILPDFYLQFQKSYILAYLSNFFIYLNKLNKYITLEKFLR